MIENDPYKMCLQISIVIICILISSVILSYKNEILNKKNSEIRNESVALITHEMRTALTSTSWAISYITKNYKGSLTENDLKMLDGVIKSIQSTVMHTVDLLNVSLLDIGKLSISLEWMKLEKIEGMINVVIEKYKMGAEKAGIVFSHKVDLNMEREVEVDIMRLRIIIENLLENSIQYIGEGKKEIDVKITDSNNRLNIDITDTGIGIPGGDQSKIFKEFFRAGNARRKLSGGSGIGLHLTEQYVKAHRGSISFESKENQGTKFMISIPLKTSADIKEFLQKV
jgi:signal transduction histidine kinase